MSRVEIDPGICGMSAVIEVDAVNKSAVTIKITSACEKVQGMSDTLSYVSLVDALKPQIYSVVYKSAAEHALCASCVVPAGILKAVEVESGLALPRPVTIKFQTT